MGAPIKLSREDYTEGLQQVVNAYTGEKTYLDQFIVDFPEGLNTASTLEICRILEKADLEAKIKMMRICIVGKPVVVTCPNGEVEKFFMSNIDDSVEAFPLFQKEPLALTAIADNIYGYILKKYIRPSKKAQGAAVKATE